jgi:hypothetical protein
MQILKPFILFSVFYAQPKISNFGVWQLLLEKCGSNFLNFDQIFIEIFSNICISK